MGSLVEGKSYFVDPRIRIPSFLPAVKLLSMSSKSIAWVQLRNGNEEALHIDWIIGEVTPLMEVLW